MSELKIPKKQEKTPSPPNIFGPLFHTILTDDEFMNVGAFEINKNNHCKLQK